jgi:DNA-directed RNA polymerase subunit RPC12/RpoP
MIEIQCPHCNGTVMVKQLNCKIFRHGVFKKNGKQINPHAKKKKNVINILKKI